MAEVVEIAVIIGHDAHAGTEQLEAIEEALEGRISEGSVRVRSFTISSPADLLEALDAAPFSAVHLLAHGSGKAGSVLFENGYNTFELEVSYIARIFAQRQIRIAVLCVCHGTYLARTLTRHVKAVVATPHPINPEAIIEFSRSFYRVLGEGGSVEEAFLSGQAGGVGLRPKYTNALALHPTDGETWSISLEPQGGWPRPPRGPTDIFLAVNSESPVAMRLGRSMVAHLGDISTFTVEQIEPGEVAGKVIGKQLGQARLIGVLIIGDEEGDWDYCTQINEAIRRVVSDDEPPRLVPILFNDRGFMPYGTRSLVPLKVKDDADVPRAMRRLARLLR